MGPILLLFVLSIYRVHGAPVPLNESAVDQYLHKYGYTDQQQHEQPSVRDDGETEQRRQKAISKFQEFLGLPVTGELDDKTKEMMIQPRCGNQDISAVRDGIGGKWDKSKLQWSIVTPSQSVNTDTVRSVIKRALDIWGEVIPMDFSEASSQPDLKVGFGRNDHGDAWPFDGPGNVLAHATFPTDGRLHFDEDEHWVNGDDGKLQSDPTAVDLLTVAVHELGHAFGVEHLRQREAIMYPAYQRTDDNGNVKPAKLSSYDIEAIQRLYGPRHGSKPGTGHGPDDSPSDSPEDSPGQRPGDRPDDGLPHTPGDRPGDRPDDGLPHTPGQRPGDRPDDGLPHAPGDRPGDNPGDGLPHTPEDGQDDGLPHIPSGGPWDSPFGGPDDEPGERPGHGPLQPGIPDSDEDLDFDPFGLENREMVDGRNSSTSRGNSTSGRTHGRSKNGGERSVAACSLWFAPLYLVYALYLTLKI